MMARSLGWSNEPKYIFKIDVGEVFVFVCVFSVFEGGDDCLALVGCVSH